MRRLATFTAVAVLALCASAQAATNVNVSSNFFDPTPLTVPPGTTVHWSLVGGSHTVTSDSGSSETFDSGTLGPPGFEHLYQTPGTFAYHCSVHQFLGMTGSVKVPGITGRVLADSDASDTTSSPDDALGGILVTAYDALAYLNDSAGAPPLDSTHTDSTGRFVLANQSPPSGSVTLVATAPAGYSPPAVVSFANSDANGVNTGKDFLLKGTGTVSGTVWNDVDGSGSQNPPEVGMGGVAVSLNGSDRSTTTASDGTYSFTNVTPGPSTVGFTVPAGFVSSGPATHSVDLNATGQDFFVKQAPGRIGGFVHDDTNGNHTADAGEGFLNDITIGLDTNGDATADQTTTTSFNGSYGFPGLAPGQTYRVIVNTPSGFENTGSAAIDVPNLQPGANVQSANFFLRRIPPVTTTEPTPAPQESPADNTPEPTIDFLGSGNGTAGDDLLNGDDKPNKIFGLAGNDLLLGLGGNDILDGGDGNDNLDGGAGNDTLKGGNGNDSLTGGPGNDKLDGQAGNDKLNGGTGKDSLIGGKGKDSFNAGPGNDTINSKDGVAESVNCGSGKDRVKADKKDKLRSCEKRL